MTTETGNLKDPESKEAIGCLGWGLRIGGGLLVLLIVLVFFSSIVERGAQARVAEQYPPTGELIEVDGQTMHIYCIGDRPRPDSPTVILDAGLGGWSLDYAELQPQIAELTQVCSYDRAGYGQSDPAEGDRDAQAIADDLYALLNAAEVDGPYILVGFSYTGLSMRLFALQHPDDVAGVMLLDPSHESDLVLYQGVLAQQQQSVAGMYGLFGSLAQVGALRILDPQEMAPYAPFIPEDQPEAYYAAISGARWWKTSQAEFVTMINGQSIEQTVDAGSFSDIPLLVVAAGDDPEGAPADIMADRRVGLEALAQQSSRGEYVLAEEASHEDMLTLTDVILPTLEDWLGD